MIPRRLILSALGVLALAGVALAAEPVRFAVAGDTRGAPGFVNVARQIKAAAGGPLQFILMPGDDDPPATTRQQITEVFGENMAWYPVVGNHDLGGLPYLRDYFARRLKGQVTPGPAGTGETAYSFDAGPVHIAVVNAYWNGQPGPGSDAKAANLIGAAQRAWLAADLQASAKPWKLVAGHPPAYPQPDANWHTARHVGESLDQKPAERDAFWQVLEQQQVAAYFCGHTHEYSRYQPARSKVWQFDAAQARDDKGSWKHDTFLLVTGDEKKLRIEAYRSLQERGHFTVTDTLTLSAP